MGGELIAYITELQRLIGDTGNPIATLDAQVPEWRQRLPLRMEEQTAEMLFNGLVRRSGELANESTSQIRWRGRLRQTENGWVAEKYLELPERLRRRQILALTGQNQTVGPRLRVMFHRPTGSEAIAWLTCAQSTNEDAVYRREWLRRGGLILGGSTVKETHRLTLHDGQTEYPLEIEGSEPWGGLPWVFIERSNPGEPEWLTEGPSTTRREQAWVLAAAALRPSPEEESTVESQGACTDGERFIYRVTGTVFFHDSDGNCYRVACRAERDSDETFSIVGDSVTGVLSRHPLYRGLPRITVAGQDGRRKLASGKIQWRPLHDGGTWREGENHCVGRIWLRLVEGASGAERFRRQIDVVPQDFCITRSIATDRAPGAYILSALMGARVELSGSEAEGIRIAVTQRTADVECPHLSSTVLPTLSLNLRWPLKRAVDLCLPYPQRGAIFQLAGRTLRRDDLIPIDRLGGLRVIVQSQTGGGAFWLDGELIAKDYCVIERSMLGFRDPLPPLVKDHCETTLLPWQDRIAALLSSTPALCLLANADQPGSWAVPTELDPGPWWIIGRDGDWARFRPLLWVVPLDEGRPENAVSDSPLAAAICEADREQRRSQLAELISELAHSPVHPDWPRLFEYVRLSREFPPTSLDLLRQLAATPKALALALIMATDDDFDSLWSLSEQMPFSWVLLPIEDWYDATRTYFEHLRSIFVEIEGRDDLVFGLFQAFKDRAAARGPFWRSLCDWFQEWLFPEHKLDGSELLLARGAPASLEALIGMAERELQGRHDADERWPQSAEVESRLGIDPNLKKYRYVHLDPIYRPVRCAPFVAAHLALKNIKPEQSLIYELRLLRAFDPEWFDTVHAIALTLGLAALTPDKTA
jgi:hypothetical protein